MPVSVMHPPVKKNDLAHLGEVEEEVVEREAAMAEEEEIPMLPMATNDNASVSVAKDIATQSRQPATPEVEVESSTAGEEERADGAFDGDPRVLRAANWLVNQVDVGASCSMARQELFDAYLQCQVEQRPVNQATFGKIVRALFPAVTSRRLGMRGHSK